MPLQSCFSTARSTFCWSFEPSTVLQSLKAGCSKNSRAVTPAIEWAGVLTRVDREEDTCEHAVANSSCIGYLLVHGCYPKHLCGLSKQIYELTFVYLWVKLEDASPLYFIERLWLSYLNLNKIILLRLTQNESFEVLSILLTQGAKQATQENLAKLARQFTLSDSPH